MLKKIFIFMALMCLSTVSLAESEKVFDKHAVSYSALNTTFITPEISKHYNIKRSDKHGLLTMAVHELPDTKPVPASIKATTKNLLGSQQSIEMRLITEGDAKYYIGTFKMDHLETLTFDITVAPEGGSEEYAFKFSKQFYK